MVEFDELRLTLVNMKEELSMLGTAIGIDKVKAEIERLEKKLSNEGFVAKAPAQVIEGERAKLAKYLETRESLSAALAKLG